MSQRMRRGFTVVELLTVSVIITVLMAVLLPAIQQSRAVDRRVDCRKQLKQIGLALLNYEETHRAFPPGFVCNGTQAKDVGGFAWSLSLLPFLDHPPLYKRFDTNRNVTDPKNLIFTATVLPEWRCPDESGPVQVELADGSVWGTTNYVGNFGVGLPKWITNEGDNTAARKVHGMFGHNSKVRIRDVRDGVSNVCMVGERRLPSAAVDWKAGSVSGPFASLWAGDPEVKKSEAQAILGSAALESATGFYAVTGPLCEGTWKGDKFETANRACSTEGAGANANPILPNKKPGPNGGELGGNISLGYSSAHPGGVQILMGDGSARFVSDSVDVTTWINLARRADGLRLAAF